MSDKLKPCPFCGSERGPTIAGCSKIYYVECGDCDCSGPSAVHPNLRTQEEFAIAAWNNRAPSQEDD